ncbi:MAG: glycine cleavage system aminomethyltransferase GcvT [Pseudomonadota bacterium]
MNDNLNKTPLNALHHELGAKMAPFAGYEMPIQYPMGVLKEHLHTRNKAGLFDVSHMGQAWLTTTKSEKGAEDAHAAIAHAMETLVPGEIRKLKNGGMRYSVLLNKAGGIVDDLMITRPAMKSGDGMLFLVVNAACKDNDYALIQSKLDGAARLDVIKDRALLALQGPSAVSVLEALIPGSADQKFMTMRPVEWDGAYVLVSRCGYTGEDGFEISVENKDAEKLARALLHHDDVEPIGLGARDSLRLEAGLCLYGNDLTEETTPVEGNIAFSIGKRRRAEGGFPGADKILEELANGAARLRVGILPEGRAPAREGAEIQSPDGETVGMVTSGGFGPSLGGPMAMGYVAAPFAETGTKVQLMVRGKALPARIADMPFVEQRYYRG